MDLVEQAQSEGNGVLELASFLLRVEDNFGPIDRATLTMRAESDGRCLYDKARELKFDHNITRRQVKRMLEKALDDLDTGWSLRCEEALGNPEYCGWMYPDRQRNPNPHCEIPLAEADKVRQLSPYFELEPEHQRADDLMNRYLKDTLCLLPDKGHIWYLELAEQYKLFAAKEYINGFYGTLKGRVWIEEGTSRRPADGAHVVVINPKDFTKWETDTDSDGKYTIKKALLHAHADEKGRQRCPKFEISATWQNCRGDDTFEGPLMRPKPDEVFEKDATITCIKNGEAKGTIIARQVTNIHRQSRTESTTSQEEGYREVEVTVQAKYELQSSSVDESRGEIEESYTVKSWDISSSLASASLKTLLEKRDVGKITHCQGLDYRIEKFFTGSGRAGKSDFSPEPTELIIVFDKKSGKAKRVMFSDFVVSVTGQSSVKTDEVHGDKGWDRNSQTYTAFRNSSVTEAQPMTFDFNLVSNKLSSKPEELPTRGMPESTRVTGGDGVRQLSGGGRIDFPESQPGQKTFYNCTWQLTREPPKKK
jgi:hypothetical protein